MNAQTASTIRSQHLVPRVAEAGSRLSRNHSGLLASLGFAALFLVSAPALAQLLGNTQSFAVLGGSSVTAGGGGATVNGDLGVAPGTSITGPVTVTLPFANHGNDAFAIAARASWVPLNNSLLAGACTPLASDQLNGQSLGPGCYSGGALDLASGGTLNLTGAGTYIFRAASSLTAGTGSNVVLNGVNPCNVFWQVTSLAAALAGATFPGTVVAAAGIHLGTGATLTGRALAGVAGDVTMAGGNNVGGCSSAGPGLAATVGSTVASAGVALLGGTISDTLTLSGGGIGSAAPTGTITFNLYGPNDATCTGAAIFTSPVIVNGNGVYTSATFTPLAAGTYRWIANYGGDANNAATANACNAANESVVVTAAALPPGGGGIGVPTLSEWAMAMLAALLAIAGFAAMRRKAK